MILDTQTPIIGETLEPFQFQDWVEGGGMTHERKNSVGYSVQFPGFEEFGFFVHEVVGYRGWVVHEKTTGLQTASGEWKETAITQAYRRLRTMGRERTAEAIAVSLAQEEETTT